MLEYKKKREKNSDFLSLFNYLYKKNDLKKIKEKRMKKIPGKISQKKKYINIKISFSYYQPV